VHALERPTDSELDGTDLEFGGEILTNASSRKERQELK